MRWLSGVLVAAVVLTGCGVRSQDSPERITIATSPTTEEELTAGSGDPRVIVYFVRGNRLEPVEREVPARDLGTALDALVLGPTQAEVVAGLRTALAPQELGVTLLGPAVPTVSIDVTRDFVGVAGGNQLLAVAQVVWTVTEFDGIRRVRLTSGGTPLQIPTDTGLTDGSVSRRDFRSVAAPSGEPTTTPRTTPSPSRETTPDTAPGSGTPPARTAPTTADRRRHAWSSREPGRHLIVTHARRG